MTPTVGMVLSRSQGEGLGAGRGADEGRGERRRHVMMSHTPLMGDTFQSDTYTNQNQIKPINHVAIAAAEQYY